MREIKIFLASSTDGEFEEERNKFCSDIMDHSRKHYESDGIMLKPIISDRQGYGTDGKGAQDRYDRLIEASRLVIVLVGRKVGPHTQKEYELAVETCKKRQEEAIKAGELEKTAKGTPRVCVYFKAAEETEDGVIKFKERAEKDRIYHPPKDFTGVGDFIRLVIREVDNCLADEKAQEKEKIKKNEKSKWARKGFILCLVLAMVFGGNIFVCYHKYTPRTEQIRIYGAGWPVDVNEIMQDLDEVGKGYIEVAKRKSEESNEHLNDTIGKVEISPGIIKVDYEPEDLLITKTEVESSIAGAIEIERIPLSDNAKIKVGEMWEEGDGRNLIFYLKSGKANSNLLYVAIQPSASIVSAEDQKQMGWE